MGIFPFKPYLSIFLLFALLSPTMPSLANMSKDIGSMPWNRACMLLSAVFDSKSNFITIILFVVSLYREKEFLPSGWQRRSSCCCLHRPASSELWFFSHVHQWILSQLEPASLSLQHFYRKILSWLHWKKVNFREHWILKKKSIKVCIDLADICLYSC